MQVWNVLHAARYKCMTQKSCQKSPSGHHPTTLSGYIFTTKACIDNRKKNLLSSNISYMSPQYGELRPTSDWERFVSLGSPGNFNGFRVLAPLLHGTLVVGVSQTAALNRGRHLYSAGRLSRWALAHISSYFTILVVYIAEWHKTLSHSIAECFFWLVISYYIFQKREISQYDVCELIIYIFSCCGVSFVLRLTAACDNIYWLMNTFIE